MAQLSIYLPPFAGDYAGVCSALFDFNCLILIQDAACCTRNYVDYDEPRWDRTKRTTLCAQLRTMDAILGNDARLVNKAVTAARELRPDFIALLGSPVPALIGTDFPGIAREVEAACGIPALGFSTTGFSPYTQGVDQALCALLERFVQPPASPVRNGVNLLGLTPLDFGATGNDTAVTKALEEREFTMVCPFCMGVTLDQVRAAARAQVNLVVSRSGLSAARTLERRFGIPYVAGVPVGEAGADRLAVLLQASALDGRSRILQAEETAAPGERPLLILGDQIISNSLRAALRLAGERRSVAVGSFFGLDPELSAPGDLSLEGEAHLLRLLRENQFQGLIADPLVTHLPPAKWLWWSSFPHPAVSSNLHWDEVPTLMGDGIRQRLLHWAHGQSY